MTNLHSLEHLCADAVASLTGEHWAITDAASHVPPRPGLYAIYGDEQAWIDLGLAPETDRPLYVGKAENSLVSRDLNGHFATNPNSRPRTGGSTVRRSFAALLRGKLDLHAVPGNPAKPERFANYALADGGDARLNEWMHARLTLAVWMAPAGMGVKLGDVETHVIARFTPPFNLEKNPGKLARLSRARADMAAEASRWRAQEPVKSIDGLIQFLTAAEGGRKNPPQDFKGPYRPHLRVQKEYLGVRIDSDTTEEIRPGIDYHVRLELLYSGVDYSELAPGVRFEILDGARVVGTGQVL